MRSQWRGHGDKTLGAGTHCGVGVGDWGGARAWEGVQRAVLKTAMKEVIQIMTALNAKGGRTEVALGTVMLAQHQ